MVDSTNSSVVVGIGLFIVVPSVDTSKDENRDEYSVELMRFSFVVDIELDTDSVDSQNVVGACVYRIVFSVVPVGIVDNEKADDSVEVPIVSDEIDWLLDWVTSLFVVAFEDEMALVSRLELWTVDVWIVDDELISVTAADDLGWLLVAYSDVDFSVITVECMDVLAVVTGWTDDVSKIDVITVELWSAIDEDAVVPLASICVIDDDGTDELSVELEILLIAVVGTSVSDEDVVISMEVPYERDAGDNDEYSLDANVFSLLVLEVPDDIVEINGRVDSSDSIDVVWSFWELNRVVNTDVSDEISSLFPVVADAVVNEFICSIVECR